MTIPDNTEAPHKALIWIRAEVHEVMKTGECTGRPVMNVEQFPVYIDGTNRDMAIRILNDLLAEFKQRCKQHQN